MNRRTLGVASALFFAALALSGCDWPHEGVRQRNKAEAVLDKKFEEDNESQKVGRVQSEPPKGFFRSSHLSGAMSDEGRDIERNLGIK